MIDESLQQRLANRFFERRRVGFWRGLVLGAIFSAGTLLSVHYATYKPPTDDELGKLATVAACSTGESTVLTWAAAEDQAQGLLGLDRERMLRELLLRVDVDGCRFRRTADRY